MTAATMTSSSSLKNVVVMCGPSGAGKTTLFKRLMSDFPKTYGFSVSHTTRSPREGETDGVDYHYVSKERMEEKIKGEEMIEYARVHSNTYGTSIQSVEDVLAQGKKCILDIDVQGVESVKKTKLCAQSLFIFISPPDLATLEERLRSRGTETEEAILTRIGNARQEMEFFEKTKSEAGYWDAVVVNDDVERAYEEFKGVCGH